LTFSLPEAWGRKRYDLRARLRWAGFGTLQNGVWLAPNHVDVTGIIESLELEGLVRVFHTRPAAPTDAVAVVRETFDLDSLARSYRDFAKTWEKVSARDLTDSLLLTLRLSTQWLRIIRVDPRVPVHLLPADWPAVRAERLFRRLHHEHRRAAELSATALLDTNPVERRRRKKRKAS
jgi:phenylacetic acid degradation operon negative regulatory protein